MKIPFANVSITIFRAYQTTTTGKKPMPITAWKRTVIHDCYTYSKSILQNQGEVLLSVEQQLVQIPWIDDFLIKQNDLVVMREIDDDISSIADFNEVCNKYDDISFRVSSVKYNKGPIAHIVLGG